jgi:hypothetical protein
MKDVYGYRELKQIYPQLDGPTLFDKTSVSSVCTTAHSIRNSIETKAENNRLEAKQYPAIQRNLNKNTIDSGAQSKTHNIGQPSTTLLYGNVVRPDVVLFNLG